MIISSLVAMNADNVIGVNNDLPWKLKDDLQHFKNYSMNKAIIMGRNTYDSIGRPLPNRFNIVVSSTMAETEDLTICLLYTSPSPRDRTRSRMPSSA